MVLSMMPRGRKIVMVLWALLLLLSAHRVNECLAFKLFIVRVYLAVYY